MPGSDLVEPLDPDTTHESAGLSSPGASRARLVGLTGLLVGLLLLPAVLHLAPVQRAVAAAGATDSRPRFLAVSLVNAGGAPGFVSSGHANQVGFQLTNSYKSRLQVRMQVLLVPDHGRPQTLTSRAFTLTAGQGRFAEYSGPVPCTSRSRLVFRAQVDGARPVQAYFHVFAYRSHGVLICSSNPGVQQL